MNVSELMATSARTCRPDDPCSVPAQHMWDGDCGCVPVTLENGELCGIVTDRDLCMAAHTSGRSLAGIPVARAMSTTTKTCLATDPIEKALETMSTHQVHRLPVIDAEGRLTGVVSLTDVVRQVSRGGARTTDVIQTIASITRPRGETVVEIQPAAKPAQAATTAPAKTAPAQAAPAKQAPAKQNPRKTGRAKR